ncbi:FecR family protein [Chitinophaga sp. NPDC101104]|uniref:FecR family protein n=1 Tax=Chitinophaga sp. NPDC101104 TaxID=3390561 RepID=UPI003D011342
MEERIHYLFKRYRDNACTRQEYEEFFALLQQADHDEAVRQLIRQAWNSDEELPHAETYVNRRGRLVHPAGRQLRLVKMAVAAALVATVTTAAWLLYPRSGNSGPAAMTGQQTARKETRQLSLPDGTQVWLNTASTLRYAEDFGRKARTVYLSGEAYFDVAHNGELPFIIHTGNISTTVLGTAFNIRAYPGQADVIVAVSSGKVKVQYGKEKSATLTGGQLVKVRPEFIHDDAPRSIATKDAAPWKDGNMLYDGEKLADIISDLERTYDVRIRLARPALGEEPVSTEFRRDVGAEAALKILCKLTDSRLTLADGTYLIH